MKKITVFFITFICFGCNESTKKQVTKSDTVVVSKKIVDRTSTPGIKKDQLLGIWTDGSTENATFDIRKDSIYYVEHFESYKYAVKNDSILIYYPDFTYKANIYFAKDTLVMTSKEDGEARFWKFKD